MDDLNDKKERIDEDLEKLEIHAPSMRFTKSVLERVKLETDLIKKEKPILLWVPKVCIAGFVMIMIALLLLSLNDESQIVMLQKEQIVNMLTNALFILGGLTVFLFFDRWIRGLLIKQ